MEEGGKAKKGYSIWSLLVIMTLLAVWMAIPRRATTIDQSVSTYVFFVCHQVALWILSGIGLWLAFGKRKWLMSMLATVIILMWTPISLSALEAAVTGRIANTYSEQCIRAVGLHEFYAFIYGTLYKEMGYGDL